MRFSVFTPTHRPDYIHEAFESLQAQSCTDWEWAIVPNGSASIAEAIRADTRVRVVPAPEWVARLGAGALKRFACDQCVGEFLVELDHDDLLLPEALARIAAAVDATGAEFLYSDFANFRADGSCEVYDAAYGWESYPFQWRGHTYTALRAFAPDASSLHLIFFAPNRVRVWSRSAYQRAGGHDSTLGGHRGHLRACLRFPRARADLPRLDLQSRQRRQVAEMRRGTDARDPPRACTGRLAGVAHTVDRWPRRLPGPHGSYWNPNSFWYYTRREQAKYVPGIQCRFQGARIWQTFPTDRHKTHNIIYVYGDLVALNGQRQPGICEI